MKNFLFAISVVLLASFVQQERVTVFLVGDSTMQTYKDLKNPQRGWGQVFQSFFDTAAVKVENHAIGGRSSKSFLKEGRWERVMAKVKKGDYIFIQFGHNDASKNKPERYTTPDSFKLIITKYVTETREKGAFPVLLTQTCRRDFDTTGVYTGKKGVYAELMVQLGTELNVPLIDMNLESSKIVQSLGKEGAKKMYMCFAPGENEAIPEGKTDNTHLQEYGALKMAEIAAKGVRDLKLPIANSLKLP